MARAIACGFATSQSHQAGHRPTPPSPAPAAGSVVIWLSPEPTLYQNEAQQRWRETLANNQIGLFILGLPHDDAGREALTAALKPRGEIAFGPSLNKHLAGANWIWTPGKPKDDSTVFLHKYFE